MADGTGFSEADASKGERGGGTPTWRRLQEGSSENCFTRTSGESKALQRGLSAERLLKQKFQGSQSFGWK